MFSEYLQILNEMGREGPVVATLYRIEPRDAEVATGARVVLGDSGEGQQNTWYVDVQGLRGELPTSIRIEPEKVSVWAESENSWRPVDAEGEAFRIFTLLDPRLLRQITEENFCLDDSYSSPGVTRLIGVVNLADWEPRIPRDLVSWLKDSWEGHSPGWDRGIPKEFVQERISKPDEQHLVDLYFKEGALLYMVQQDLPPWQDSRIVARFARRTAAGS